MIGRELLERYRLYDRVGEGGFASVYLARDLETNVVVAVKLLHPQFATDPAYVRRFHREAALLRELEHPQIVRLLDDGEEDDLALDAAGNLYVADSYNARLQKLTPAS